MKTLAVILPTYNAAHYLKTAIDSVLNQSFSDFHLYIFDDCSTDSTKTIIEVYNDHRIFYQKNHQNYGIAKTLNLAFSLLQDKYMFLARMDADDWCFPERFEKQLAYLNQNPDIAMCGTQGYWVRNIDFTPKNPYKIPCTSLGIKINLLFSASFGHSSIIFRSNFLKKHKVLYNETIKTCEDWDLWTDIIKHSEVANLDLFLMKYRVLENSNHRTAKNLERHTKERCAIISKHWLSFNVVFSPEDIKYYYYEDSLEPSGTFMINLNKLISQFNKLYLEIDKISNEEKARLSYKLIRFIIEYRKRKHQLRFSLSQSLILFKNIKFVSSFQLLKQLMRN